jgi:hypothetical protein
MIKYSEPSLCHTLNMIKYSEPCLCQTLNMIKYSEPSLCQTLNMIRYSEPCLCNQSTVFNGYNVLIGYFSSASTKTVRPRWILYTKKAERLSTSNSIWQTGFTVAALIKFISEQRYSEYYTQLIDECLLYTVLWVGQFCFVLFNLQKVKRSYWIWCRHHKPKPIKRSKYNYWCLTTWWKLVLHHWTLSIF